jgi:hypothetical protein
MPVGPHDDSAYSAPRGDLSPISWNFVMCLFRISLRTWKSLAIAEFEH